LKYREAVRNGVLLHRARARAHAAAGRPVGLRENERNVVAGVVQRGEGLRCKLRSTREDETQEVC
jgi:hypothetical protein